VAAGTDGDVVNAMQPDASASLFQGSVRALRTAWWWVQEYFGEHEYDRYLADWQARHAALDPAARADHQPMSRRAFYAHRLEVKYGGTVQRCC